MTARINSKSNSPFRVSKSGSTPKKLGNRRREIDVRQMRVKM